MRLLLSLCFLICFTGLTYAQPVPFECDNRFHMIFGEQGQSLTYDLTTDTFVIAPEQANRSMNAAGYREVDNLGYAIFSNSNELAQISADGSVVNLGPVNGLPENISIPAGSFGNDGLLYVYRGGVPDIQNTIFGINVDTRQVEREIDIQGPNFVVADIALNPNDGLFYGVSGNYEGVPDTVLFTIDIESRTTQVIGPVIGPVASAAAFADSSGVIYTASTRNTQPFAAFDTETGEGIVLGNVAVMPVTVDGGVDGFFCAASPGPVATFVPTLSEWGMIAMAGILGIVAFIYIRKRKAVV
ncbi:MAG: IPTL-CTERM sorting domain-containing protein [Thermodesulfobacteriota bacterium]